MAVAILTLLALVLLRPISALQNITLGSSLLTNDRSSPWLSPSGDFAFGFHKLGNTSFFLLAIWFHKIPDKTVVWHANGDNPAPQGSTLLLNADGLVLADPEGQPIWKAEVNQNAAVSYGTMLDTGNLVLVDDKSVYLWQSFNNPTDTILPSQVLDSEMVLFSRLTETNFARGRFELYFSNDDLELSPVGWPGGVRYGAYFSSGTTSNSSTSENHLVYNQSLLDIFLAKTNGVTIQLPWQKQTIVSALSGYYCRATLDYDGVFTQYVYPRNTDGEQSWSVLRYIPEDICSSLVNGMGSGACGYNSYCRAAVNGRPNCTCPPGYSFIDRNNQFSGCKPNFPQGCGVDDAADNLTEVYEMQELQDVNWSYGDYERLEPFSQEECRISCLQDCMCDVALYGSSICWKKRIPLSSGRRDGSLALVKIRKGASYDYPGHACRNEKKDDKAILFGSLGTSLGLNALMLIVIPILLLKLKKKSAKTIHDSTVVETNLRIFSYNELTEATGNFKEEIGRGSSAIVYKGILSSGRKTVAVKKLDKLTQGAEKEFRTELNAIGKTSHKNLVRLLGFCEEGAHRLLVYEFMTNGTLRNFLQGIPKPGWDIRAKIALQIARGLMYLHEECEVPIIHCDIKPENILLDESLTPKISDLGLVKLLQTNQSQTLTNIRGTRGYVAPEWFRNVAVTAKIDVYSYGVVLMEIICCRKNVSKLEDEKAILTEYVYYCLMEGKLDAVVEFIEWNVADKHRLETWLIIAIWCIQEDPSKRPSMKMVLQMLEESAEVPALPEHYSSYTL